MAETHKKKRHVSHKRRHHDPVKKQEILDKVDALLKEEPEEKIQPEISSPPDAPVVSPPVAPNETLSQPQSQSVSAPAESQPVITQTASATQNTSASLAAPSQPDQSQSTTSQPIVENTVASPAESIAQASSPESGIPVVTDTQTTGNEVDKNTSESGSSSTPAGSPPWRNDAAEQEVDSSGGNSVKKKIVTFVIFVIVLVVSVVGGYFIYSKVLRQEPAQKESNVSTSVLKGTKEVSPTASVVSLSPTKKPIDFSAYSIKVLNGSGIRGEASSAKTLLEDEGFKVESVGNADASDYVKTLVKTSEDIDNDYLDKLKEVLGKEYVLSGVKEIDVNETVDVVVILGSTKAEE